VNDLFAPADVAWTPVSPKLAQLRLVSATIGCGLLALFVALPLGLFVGWPWAVLTLVVLLAAYIWGWILIGRNQRSWKYAEREDELLVTHGVMFRELVVVPYGRMQFVDVTAGPLERSLGLATLRLHTAAAASDARIPGLPRAEADRLRDQLGSLGEAQAVGL
jgi:membrane protein YdbS with pleckstrin-like domain